MVDINRERDAADQRRLEQRRSVSRFADQRRGNRFNSPTNQPSGSIESLFGLGTNNPTGNDQTFRQAGDSVGTAGDAAARFAGGAPTVDVSDDQREALGQFFNPSVTDEQNSALRKFATVASANGIQGGAVRGQLGDQATSFIGGNRAASFGQVSPLLEQGFGALQQQLSPFFSQFGGLQGLSDSPGFGIASNNSVNNVLRSSGSNLGEFQQFALPSLRALQAFGLGGDAFSGLAQRANINVAGGGTTGNDRIAQATADFFNPQANGLENFIRSQGNAGVNRNAFQARDRQLRAGNRLAGAEVLQGELQGRFNTVSSSFQDFQATGAAARGFQSQGTLQDARTLANLDTSKFAPLLSQLGVTQRQFSDQSPTLGGLGQNIPQSQLFRNVAGI